MTPATPDLTVAELLNPRHATTPDRTRTLAAAVAETVRCLNYATAGPGLTHPAAAYTLLGNLTAAVHGLDQTLRQVTAFLDAQVAAGRVEVDDGPFTGDPAAAVSVAGVALQQARTHAAALADTLNRAQQATAFMSTTTDEAGEVGP